MGRQVLSSAITTVYGWFVGWIALELIYWFGNDYFRNWNSHLLWDSLATFPLMGIFIVPTWLAILLPLHLMVSRRSRFWNPFVCVPVGALAGFLIMQAFFAYDDFVLYHTGGRHAFDVVWPFSIPAAIVGATSCLLWTMTNRRFHFG